MNERNILWCLWNNQHNVNILMNNNQCIAFSYLSEGTLIFTAAIYASTLYTIRRELWHALSTLLQDYHGPWMFIGDFNSLLGAHEILGGRTPLKIACFEFSNWTNLNALIHLETNGAQFTWTNRRERWAFMAQGIDRAICNESWIDYWSVFSCNTLVKCFSDHFPLLLTLHKNPPITIIPRFKFFKA